LGWPASGRRRAIAGDARTREVRLRHTSDEACEQGRTTGGGAGGAKGGDQGEHEPTAHATDSEPSKRVTGAGACTARCKAAEEGEVHRVAAPCDRRFTAGCVPGAQAPCRTRGGRRDMAGLRGGSGEKSPRSECSGPSRHVPGTARPATVHTETGRHAVPTNARALNAFQHYVTDLWRRTLRRRSQKDKVTWHRMTRLLVAWLPSPRILHPWPERRFAVRHPR